MKRVSNLYDKICNIDIIMDMYDVVAKNTKNKKKIEKFDKFYSINIYKIKDMLCSKNYIPGKYNIFLIQEPKYRIIMSQEIPDKVINHLVAKYFLIDVFDKTLIKENCATRIGKGTHYALNIFKNNYNKYKNKHDKFYILKLDISKYFYNIDHDIVKKIIRSKIKDKDALNIIEKIIDTTDEEYINKLINKLKNNEIDRINNLNISENLKKLKIEEVSKLPIYNKKKGLPIGSMVSQIIATLFIDKIDKFIKYDLKIETYCRFMDDMAIIHYDKNYLNLALAKINKILEKYNLKLNPKTKIYNSNEEIEFLGFRFCIINNKLIMKITNKTKKNFKKKIKKCCNEYNNKLITYDSYRSTKDSYIGYLRHGSCNNLMYKVLKI